MKKGKITERLKKNVKTDFIITPAFQLASGHQKEKKKSRIAEERERERERERVALYASFNVTANII